MSCSSCSTGKDGGAGGCRNNGTCGTGGCNKLNVFNWLSDMHLPMGGAASSYDVVEVRFKGSRKEFYRNKENIELKTGDVVAVEASPGHDVGVVSLSGELVRFQLKKKFLTETSDQIHALYRKARPADVDKWNEVKDQENKVLHRSRTIIQGLKLQMKLSDVEYQGDGKKATFYYTAEDRVDFRELIKKLAEEFKIRVEMRQIGMRQEAARLGGIGSCGRELCCATWLTDFKTVTTGAARYQNLSLNPAKLAGQCGKLKCCLNYELDTYVDALRNFPSAHVKLETEKGIATHIKADIFKRIIWYTYMPQRSEDEHAEAGDSGAWISISVKRANEIIELNKQKIKPPDLKSADDEEEEVIELPDYENVVGQDSINRMDHLRSKKKKKKKKRRDGEPRAEGGQRPQNAGGQQQRTNTGGQQPPRPQQQRPAQPPAGQQQQQQQQNLRRQSTCWSAVPQACGILRRTEQARDNSNNHAATARAKTGSTTTTISCSATSRNSRGTAPCTKASAKRKRTRRRPAGKSAKTKAGTGRFNAF